MWRPPAKGHDAWRCRSKEHPIQLTPAAADDCYIRRIAEILDGFGDGFMLMDADWRIVHCNRAAEEHLDFRCKDAVGRVIWSRRPAAEEGPVCRLLAEAMNSRAWIDADVASETRPGRWLNMRAFPLEGGVAAVLRDVTERHERLRLERDQAERLELALASSSLGEWSWDAATDVMDVSDLAAKVLGARGPSLHWADLVAQAVPEDRELLLRAGRRALEEHASFEIQYRTIRPADGAERWIMARGRGQCDEAGQVTGLRGVVADVTRVKVDEAQVRADRARLAELERRRAYLLEIADALQLLDDPDEILIVASRMIGERLDVGRVGYAEIGEDDTVHIRGAWSRRDMDSLFGRTFEHRRSATVQLKSLRLGVELAIDDVRVDPRTAATHAQFEVIGALAAIVVPLLRNGRLEAIFYAHEPQPRVWTPDDVALMLDVAARTRSALARARVERQAAERQRLLINELNHRVKNTLATIQSLVRQTLRENRSIDEARERLTERILALSTAHNVLNRENWRGVDFGEIAREVLRPYDEPIGARIKLSGPGVRLAPNVALAASMALHELATNAAKYGALSSPCGRVTLQWNLEQGGQAVELEWREAGGPPVTAPTSTGFGSRLLAGLAGELGAPTEMLFHPAGLICQFRAPVI